MTHSDFGQKKGGGDLVGGGTYHDTDGNRYSNNDSVVFPINLFMCVLYQAKFKKTYLSMWKIGNCKLRYNSDMYGKSYFLEQYQYNYPSR